MNCDYRIYKYYFARRQSNQILSILHRHLNCRGIELLKSVGYEYSKIGSLKIYNKLGICLANASILCTTFGGAHNKVCRVWGYDVNNTQGGEFLCYSVTPTLILPFSPYSNESCLFTPYPSKPVSVGMQL